MHGRGRTSRVAADFNSTTVELLVSRLSVPPVTNVPSGDGIWYCTRPPARISKGPSMREPVERASTPEAATAATEGGTTSTAGECHAAVRSESQGQAAQATTAVQEAAADGAAATANREGRQVAGSEGQSQAKQTKAPTSAGKRKRMRKTKPHKKAPDQRKAEKRRNNRQGE